MAQQTKNAAIDRLAVFVGEWGIAAQFKDIPPADIGARVVFEWMPGRRFLITGTFGDDGRIITGSWEICHDGATWEHDFDLTYTKIM
ncbi:MAG: hypothetical protein WCB67_06960 [Solirubrobacteraceae bacterium]